MAYKMRTSPMKQTLGVAGNINTQDQLMAMPQASAIKDYSAQINTPTPSNMATPRPSAVTPGQSQMVNPFPMNETPINPKAFSNSKAIQGVYGKGNEGTFTRTTQNNESPTMQLANPGMLQDGPQLPPQGVQTSVTPTLGFENS